MTLNKKYIVIVCLGLIVFILWLILRKRHKLKAETPSEAKYGQARITPMAVESSFGMRSGYVYGNHVYPYPVNGGGYGYGLPMAKMTRCEPGSTYNWFEGYCMPIGDGTI